MNAAILKSMVKRNIKLFFKDKGIFFTSLITPMILLVLYVTFLGNVYRDSFLSGIPAVLSVPEEVINGCVGGQLVSSLLAVSCVTVAFCSNMLMVQDKTNGARKDLTTAPVKSSLLATGYYVAALISTLIVNLTAAGAGLIYLAATGWYLTASDVWMILLDVFILVMFGTVLSSVINFFLSSQGQISAVGTIISSCYGFICGAYMPISQFSEGIRKAIMFLPGTYGTALIRGHLMRGALAELEEYGLPAEVVEQLKDVVDCNLYFFENKVGVGTMFAVIIITVAVLLAAYILLNCFVKKEK